MGGGGFLIHIYSGIAICRGNGGEGEGVVIGGEGPMCIAV